MGLEHNTSERLTPKDPSSLGKDNVVEFDRIFAVRGPDFQQRFLAGVIMPMRQDVAVMALQQLLRAIVPYAAEVRVGTSDEEHKAQLTEQFKRAVAWAFFIADEFCFQAPATLDKRSAEYFDMYMKRGSLDDIIKAAMEEAHDYSQPGA